MANAAASNEAKPPRKINWVVAGIGLGMVLAATVAVFFAFRFVEQERARDLQAWQIRLGIVGDSRSAAVDEWIESNFAVLRELVENQALQLYMTELTMEEEEAEGTEQSAGGIGEGIGEGMGLDQPDDETQDDETAEPSEQEEAPIEEVPADTAAQATYLRNLLEAVAQRTGFVAPAAGAEIGANVERVGVAGLGLADAAGRPVASSSDMPPITGKIRKAVALALAGEPVFIDIYMGPSNLPTIGFVLPIYAIQGDEGAEGIGAAVGIRVIDKDLFDRLRQPGEIEKTAETYLVRRAASGSTVEYLSPLADGTAPLKRSLALDTPDLAAAFAIENPGGFGQKRYYSGEEVLVTSRSIPNVPWVLIRKISRTEALAGTDSRLRTILIVLVLVTVGVAVAIVAVWRHGSSLRAMEAAERSRISSERFENMSKFMKLVTNSQPTIIAAVDGATTYTFANEPAAREAGIPVEDVIGKAMASVMGPVKANALAEINTAILKQFALEDDVEAARQQHILRFGEGDDLQVIKSDHIPLRGDRDHPPGVLMVLDDITELTRERLRSEKMLRQLIDTLVSVVDRRDPYSANHSSRMAEVARCIAEEMGLSDTEVKTVDIASSLMSLGKIFISPELLTKTGNLTAEERNLIATSYLVSADLLEGVPFEGPVVDTIRQMGETWEGQGPLGLAGEDILRTARIAAVANTFVGMISPRAYRDAMTFEKVSDILLQESGSKFDRKAVSALINFLENRGGTERWAHYREKPKEAA